MTERTFRLKEFGFSNIIAMEEVLSRCKKAGFKVKYINREKLILMFYEADEDRVPTDDLLGHITYLRIYRYSNLQEYYHAGESNIILTNVTNEIDNKPGRNVNFKNKINDNIIRIENWKLKRKI